MDEKDKIYISSESVRWAVGCTVGIVGLLLTILVQVTGIYERIATLEAKVQLSNEQNTQIANRLSLQEDQYDRVVERLAVLDAKVEQLERNYGASDGFNYKN